MPAPLWLLCQVALREPSQGLDTGDGVPLHVYSHAGIRFVVLGWPVPNPLARSSTDLRSKLSKITAML